MLNNRDLAISHESQVSYFGISMNQSQCQKIKKKLDKLKASFPGHCRLTLYFEKRKSAIVGTLTISSLIKKRFIRKTSHTPYQTYLQLEDEANLLLQEWDKNELALNFAMI